MEEKETKEKETKKKETKKRGRAINADGFAEGSANAAMFEALKGGCTLAKLEKINPNRAKPFIRWIQKPIESNVTEARAAKVKVEGDSYKITTYATKDGKNHRA